MSFYWFVLSWDGSLSEWMVHENMCNIQQEKDSCTGGKRQAVDGTAWGGIVLQKLQRNQKNETVSATLRQPAGDPNMASWTIKITDEAEREIRHYFKRHPRETASVLANTESILGLLNSGKRIGGFQVGYFRSEGDGLYRVGQTGVKAAKETRLYVFPDEAVEIIHVIGIGDKETQQRDIRSAKKTVDALRVKN